MSDAGVLTRHPVGTAAAPATGRILIIDDEAEIRESLQTLLELEGYEVTTAANGAKGLARVGEKPFDLVLLDKALPDQDGFEVLASLRERDNALPVIMITAYGTLENAVHAMQAGATNFIQKPWDNEKLLADVRETVRRRRVEEENVQLKRALKQRYSFDQIVGKSEPMLRIFDLIAQLYGSHSGRERDRQGSGCQGHPPLFPAQRSALCSREHGLHARRPARIHALRAR
jgi:DNA-binding NtrC family response regulator